jgi:hypothetical protein
MECDAAEQKWKVLNGSRRFLMKQRDNARAYTKFLAAHITAKLGKNWVYRQKSLIAGVGNIPPASSAELQDARNRLMQNIRKKRKKRDMTKEELEEQRANARAYQSTKYHSDKELVKLGLK